VAEAEKGFLQAPELSAEFALAFSNLAEVCLRQRDIKKARE
jgi:hypothetical protein